MEYTYEESTHTKTGNPIWVLRLKERLADDFKSFSIALKQTVGGGCYYSRYVRGWIFKEDVKTALDDFMADYFSGNVKSTANETNNNKLYLQKGSYIKKTQKSIIRFILDNISPDGATVYHLGYDEPVPYRDNDPVDISEIVETINKNDYQYLRYDGGNRFGLSIHSNFHYTFLVNNVGEKEEMERLKRGNARLQKSRFYFPKLIDKEGLKKEKEKRMDGLDFTVISKSYKEEESVKKEREKFDFGDTIYVEQDEFLLKGYITKIKTDVSRWRMYAFGGGESVETNYSNKYQITLENGVVLKTTSYIVAKYDNENRQQLFDFVEVKHRYSNDFTLHEPAFLISTINDDINHYWNYIGAGQRARKQANKDHYQKKATELKDSILQRIQLLARYETSALENYDIIRLIFGETEQEQEERLKLWNKQYDTPTTKPTNHSKKISAEDLDIFETKKTAAKEEMDDYINRKMIDFEMFGDKNSNVERLFKVFLKELYQKGEISNTIPSYLSPFAFKNRAGERVAMLKSLGYHDISSRKATVEFTYEKAKEYFKDHFFNKATSFVNSLKKEYENKLKEIDTQINEESRKQQKQKVEQPEVDNDNDVPKIISVNTQYPFGRKDKESKDFIVKFEDGKIINLYTYGNNTELRVLNKENAIERAKQLYKQYKNEEIKEEEEEVILKEKAKSLPFGEWLKSFYQSKTYSSLKTVLDKEQLDKIVVKTYISKKYQKDSKDFADANTILEGLFEKSSLGCDVRPSFEVIETMIKMIDDLEINRSLSKNDKDDLEGLLLLLKGVDKKNKPLGFSFDDFCDYLKSKYNGDYINQRFNIEIGHICNYSRAGEDLRRSIKDFLNSQKSDVIDIIETAESLALSIEYIDDKKEVAEIKEAVEALNLSAITIAESYAEEEGWGYNKKLNNILGKKLKEGIYAYVKSMSNWRNDETKLKGLKDFIHLAIKNSSNELLQTVYSQLTEIVYKIIVNESEL